MALNDVPQSGQTLNDTRNPIRNNFAAINTAFLVNHEEYNTANQGKHTWIALTQRAGPTPFVLGEVGLSNYLLALTNTNELFVDLFNSAGTKFSYPISSSILSTNPAPAYASVGWAYLPSGLIVKWGIISIAFVAGAANLPISYATAGTGPVFTNIINVQLTPRAQAAQPVLVVGPTLAAPNTGVNPQTIPIYAWQITNGNVAGYTGNANISYLVIGA